MRSRLAVLALLLVASCGSPEEENEPVEQGTQILTSAKGAPIEIVVTRTTEEIARLEDARSLGGGRLLELLASDPDPHARERAAVALGRFPYPRFGDDVTVALARALEDSVSEVKRAAAFALGIRGDRSATGTLLAYCNDPDSILRARAVEAACRLDQPDTHAQLALALRDADLDVRKEAAVGTARWATDAPGARDVDRALLDALHPYRITPDSTPKSAVEAELVWRILWALGRRKAELGRGAFLEYASSSVALERLFALRGLGEIPPDPASWKAAAAALVGPRNATDWRVAYEAVVALGRFAGRAKELVATAELRKPVIEALQAGSEHRSAHVRAGTMEAVGSFPDGEDVRALLQRGRLDLSPSVRAAALRARVRISAIGDALDVLGREARDDDPVVRAAVAEAASGVADPRAAAILERLTRDPSLFVATRALEKLGKHLEVQPSVRATLHGGLAHADNGMRLSAVMGLREKPDPSDVTPLAQAYTTSKGDVAAEVAYCALQDLGMIGSDDARRVVADAVSDARPYVRYVARRVLHDSFDMDVPLTEGDVEPATPQEPPPVPGKDEPLWRFDPMVEMVTSRGTMVFELFPAEAPLHVHSFLALVEGGAYKDLTFHRVVPDFVVQGGDYRGDGNGALPWKGESLRAEFTPRKYTRGSLGMPRNDDPDSGGSQFFITHVPTPHLDGRYTIFGELRRGGEVLDQLEVGDRILSVTLLH